MRSPVGFGSALLPIPLIIAPSTGVNRLTRRSALSWSVRVSLVVTPLSWLANKLLAGRRSGFNDRTATQNIQTLVDCPAVAADLIIWRCFCTIHHWNRAAVDDVVTAGCRRGSRCLRRQFRGWCKPGIPGHRQAHDVHIVLHRRVEYGLSLLIAAMAYLPLRARLDLPDSAGLAVCHVSAVAGIIFLLMFNRQ